MKIKRKSGILLHISSLPSSFGIGDFGVEAYVFVDQLVKNGFSLWQILPLGPSGAGNSPYQSFSAYAGNMLFISPSELFNWNLISELDIQSKPLFSENRVEFELVSDWKNNLIKKAWNNFINYSDDNFKNEFNAFKREHNWWLADYSIFIACRKKYNNTPWNEWPEGIARRNRGELEKLELQLNAEIEYENFVQFLFFRQWFRLKKYANEKGIEIFGDLPLYVSYDSSDVWANQNIFLLNENGDAKVVGGVPPDYFSESGQLWGNPVFNWDELAGTDYQWWIARIYFNLHLFNLVRIDHFRGLESFWAIPADSETAINGKWLPANGMELFNKLKSQMSELPIVAEDLGVITPEVIALRDAFQFPGMKVFQFAFTSDYSNEHLPHNYNVNCVAYTGTHDNDTIIGWFNSLDYTQRSMLKNYISFKRGTIAQQIIELVWSSSAETVIIPMQDLLALGSSARMNTPGTAEGNWHWRYLKKQTKKEYFQFFRNLNLIYNRYHGDNL